MLIRGVWLCGLALVSAATAQSESPKDRGYLLGVAKDTWRCIASLEAPNSGLPYDNSQRGDATSVSNIGIYLTSVIAAEKLGFITHHDAVNRLERTLTTLEKLKQWHGFQQTWNSVTTLQPGSNDPWISVLDSGNLCAGLLTVAGAYPEEKSRALRLWVKTDWAYFFDNQKKMLVGGFNTKTNSFNANWHLDTLGTDAFLAQFFAVATGAAPVSFYDQLVRRKISWEGQSFLWPGMEGGGLFMQYISGLWLDLQGTELGNSGEAFARAQVAHSHSLGSPVWGWSASDNPDGGYLGWASLKDEVVTPHACVLPIDSMPKETVTNLKKLEELGARSEDMGFFDAYNWKTHKVARNFLVLDQGMLLISLANHLSHNCIRQAFQSNEVVRRGRELCHL